MYFWRIPVISIAINFYFLELEAHLIVETKTGLIQGTEAITVDLHKPYLAFLGIPYAEPPIGNLRFSAPVPVKKWEGVLNATTYGKSCVQLDETGVEDCLFLNVYKPSKSPETRLPVMVWIHGGFSKERSGGSSNMGPDYIVNENVIVVTFNYRLGVLGFLSTEDQAATGNWALKDQILALKWAHDNIKYFGGDPDSITVFAQGAGSAFLSYLVQTPLTRHLFQKAIMQSGISLNSWALCRNPRKTAFDVGKRFQIFTSNSTYLMQLLRQIDYRLLERVSTGIDLGQYLGTNSRNGYIFAPCIEPEHDGAVISGKSHELLQRGEFNRIPVIIGFNSQEGIPFDEILETIRLNFITYEIVPDKIIPAGMNISNFAIKQVVARNIKNHYFGLTPIVFSSKKLIQFLTDDQFVRGIIEAARLMSKYTSVYLCMFSYKVNLGIDAGLPPRQGKGVGNGEDLNYIWSRGTSIADPSQSDILTRRKLTKLWTNFAKTSNTTPNEDPLLQNVTWLTVNPTNQNYLNIGESLKMDQRLSKYSISWWRDLYEKYGNPPYDTY